MPKEDKTGLERSVLTYVDISCQKPAKFYLIIDESYGKALFSVDNVYVYENEIVGIRGISDPINEEVVTRFSPNLVWRIVNQSDVYLQPTRVVMEREAEETKELREYRTKLIKDAGLDGPAAGEIGERLGHDGQGQYL